MAAKPGSVDLQVLGVVSGYRPESQPVYVGENEVAEMAALANTGIVIATDIKHAVEAIEGN